MSYRRPYSCVFLILLLAAASGAVWAQRGTAKLEGTITDETGGRVPGVAVTALNTETGVARETISNDSGYYVFPSLAAAAYTVTAEIPGFKKSTVEDLKLDVAATAVHNFILEVGQLTEEVTVTAEGAALIQTTSSDIASTVSENTIKMLPLNGREALELIQISAGVAGNIQQSEQGSAADQGRNVGGLGVNGARASNNAIYQDGVDITNSEYGAAGDPDAEQFGITAGTDLSIPVDAVQEFRVIALNPTAEFGKNSGAQVEIVTKSGTNDFHGAAYWFHRNTVFNANEFFNNRNQIDRPRLLRNQFGASIGGPVILPYYNGENKTFFFFNYEGFRERKGTSVTRGVLTQEARNGLFRYNLDGQNSAVVIDPRTGAVDPSANIGVLDVDASDRTDWEGIGKDTSGVVSRYISLTPLPNDFSVTSWINPDGNTQPLDGLNWAGFRFNASDPVNRFNWVAKVDHILNDVHSLSGRVSHGEVTSVVNVAPFPGLPSRDRQEEQNGVSLNWVQAYSSSIINETRFGFTRNTRGNSSNITRPGDIVIDCDNAFDCLGITNPDLTEEADFIARQTMQLSDSFTWNRGNHELKFGYTFRSNPLNLQEASRAINFDFNTEPRNEQGSVVNLDRIVGTPNPIDDEDRIPAANYFNFITGRMGGVFGNVNALSTDTWGDFSSARVRGFRQREHSWFVQDTWRVTPNLTFNYGLRHEIYLVPYEVNSFFTQPSNRSLVDAQLADPAAGCNSFGQADAFNRCEIPFVDFGAIGPKFGTQVHPNDWNNFAPVLGFSWDPFGDGKTAVRASYRIAYDKIFTRTLNSLDDEAPGLQFETVINGDSLRDVGVTNFVAPGGALAGQPRPVRLADLKGSSVGDITLGGTFNLADFLSAPGVNIPDEPLGFISPTRQSVGPQDFMPDFKTAYAQSWSLSVQREIMRNTAIEVRYIGRKGVHEYLGLPGNEFRASPEFNREIQNLQYLLTGGELGLAPATLPAGFQVGTPVPVADLFGTSPNDATDYSQFLPGIYDTYAFSQFPLSYPFFLAGTGRFDGSSGIAGAITRNDWVSTIARYDNNTNFHSNEFLASVPLNAVPSGLGLAGCPDGRDPNRNRFGCLPIIVQIAEGFFRPTIQFLNGPRIVGNSASSDYHAFQFELTRRMTDGLQFQVNYGYSKNLDITSVTQPTGQDAVSFFCIQCDRALSDNDLTHDFKFSSVWEIPIGQGRRWGSGMASAADHILGGWTVAGFMSWASDFPLNVAVRGTDRTAPPSTGGIRPTVREGFTFTSDTAATGKVNKTGDGVFYFTPAEVDFLRNQVFERTLIGNLGNAPRNPFRGPGWFNVDLMLSKSFDLAAVRETMSLDFRAEFFNLLNIVNFANPSLAGSRGPYVDLNRSDAGIIDQTLGNPRLIQFALKLNF